VIDADGHQGRPFPQLAPLSAGFTNRQDFTLGESSVLAIQIFQHVLVAGRVFFCHYKPSVRSTKHKAFCGMFLDQFADIHAVSTGSA